jgi:hypothetical protein
MTETTTASVAPPEQETLSLRKFFLAAVLWLPLAFFLWYVLRGAVVYPATRIAGAVLTGWMPDLFVSAGQRYETFIYTVAASAAGVEGLGSGALQIDLDVNALMYCYGTAVLGGLVMATPLDWTRTFVQLIGGWLLMLPFQAFGLVGEALRDVAFNLGAAVQSGLAGDGYAAVAAQAGSIAHEAARTTLAGHGLGLELVGHWYQFGFLILPSITPVVIWILFNRRLVQSLGGFAAAQAEPAPTPHGQKHA